MLRGWKYDAASPHKLTPQVWYHVQSFPSLVHEQELIDWKPSSARQRWKARCREQPRSGAVSKSGSDGHLFYQTNMKSTKTLS